jgi:alpha/beta superfamily hydrolase
LATVLAACLIGGSVWMLERERHGLVVLDGTVGATPVTIHQSETGPAGPAVVIAHGFAGSRQIMQSFALTLARAGYTAVSFDFSGHGRHPDALGGDLRDEAGATQALLLELQRVVAYARSLVPDEPRVGLVGHSMASDIVVRAAAADPEIAATVAVSMFSPALSAEHPRNLLVVVGDLESSRLKDEGRRAVRLTHGPEPGEAGETVGAFADGTARRVVFARNADHVGVLFVGETLRETRAWLDAAFDRASQGPVPVRGLWIALLLLGVALVAWPLFQLVPKVREFPTGAGLGWRGVLTAALVPAVAAPLILWKLPTDFLPLIIGDYLILHFAVYGLVAALCLEVLGAQTPWGVPNGRVILASLIAALIGLALLAVPLDRYFTSFIPTGLRLELFALMAVAALPYFVIDDWIARGRGWGWARLLVTRTLLLASLLAAVALNRDELLFLIILLPMIALFFLLFGMVSSMLYRRTGHPIPGAVMGAATLAWAIASIFPVLAGS